MLPVLWTPFTCSLVVYSQGVTGARLDFVAKDCCLLLHLSQLVACCTWQYAALLGQLSTSWKSAANSQSSVQQASGSSRHRAETDDDDNLAALNGLTTLQKLSKAGGIALRRHVDAFSATAGSSFAQLGSHLNRVTGYEDIEELKRRVVEYETRITSTRAAAREAKRAYEAAVQQRSRSQREVNDLLQRKSSWRDDDVSRFTALVRQDHIYEQAEARAKEAVAEADDNVEREFNELMRAILARYHEEQVWSDKIRSASTYGSFAVLGLNLVVFILAIVVVEPWKRRRLAQTFEKRIEEMSEENRTMLRSGMRGLEQHFEKQEEVLARIAGVQSSAEGLVDHDESAKITGDESEMTKPAAFAGQEGTIIAAVDRDAIAVTATVCAGMLGWWLRGWFGS